MDSNKIYLGDCLELMDNIEDKSIDLIITDPPFYVLKQDKKLEDAEWDNFTNIEEFMSFTKNWIEKCYRILKN